VATDDLSAEAGTSAVKAEGDGSGAGPSASAAAGPSAAAGGGCGYQAAVVAAGGTVWARQAPLLRKLAMLSRSCRWAFLCLSLSFFWQLQSWS
jgi:hypothetical protein